MSEVKARALGLDENCSQVSADAVVSLKWNLLLFMT